jgi:hypothetical protein
MAALENSRHERFAQELAKGKSQGEAYVAAGYKESRSAAARLAADVNICARLAEIQERGAIRAEVTIATLTADLLRLRDKGEALMDAAGLSVARNSVMDIAKLNGLVIDKAQVDQSVQVTEIRRTVVGS